MIRWPCIVAAAAAITASCSGRAEPSAPKPRAAPAPDFIAGAGLGPALRLCEGCDGTPGVGARGFALVPLMIPLALGVTAEHERFFAPEGGFTFVGLMFVFSSGFGRTWQAELWGAMGIAASVVADPIGRGDGGVQAGLRLGRLIQPRTRLCLSVSTATSFERTSSGGSSGSGVANAGDSGFVAGAVLMAVELAYDVAPARRASPR